jgi:hypothetical protein
MSMLADLFRLRPHSIRVRLFRDLALVILLTSGAILALAASRASRTERGTARAYIERASQTARDEFQARMEPVEMRLRLVWEWDKAGLLDVQDRKTTLAKLAPVLEPLPVVAAIILADSDGRELLISRRRGEDGQAIGWTTRARGLPKSKGRVLREQWTPDRQLESSEWTTLEGYVPSERPWFQGALTLVEEDDVYRSEPYHFFELKRLGVTESMRWTSEDDVVHVVAFDLMLGDVFALVSEIEVSEGSETFLCDSNARVFLPYRAPEPGEELEGPQFVFVAAEKTGDPLIAAAVDAWKKGGSPPEEPVRFRGKDIEGWAGFRLMDPLSGIWLGVAVPNPEIFGGVPEITPQRFLVVGFILLGGLLLAVRLVRKYGHQLKDVPKQLVAPQSFEQDVRKLISRGEGPTLEFKSTIRMNLKTGKNGKEIELAWLKGAAAFMNTDGGTLLLGIGDDGEVLGVEPDDFANEDKCRLHLKNLVNQHIGAEHSPRVRFLLGHVDDRCVVAVQCERSNDPVFLKSGNQEQFFIRSGPSSVELTPREVLEYVARR